MRLCISDHSLNCDHRAQWKRERRDSAPAREKESYCGSFKGELYLCCCCSERRRVIKNAGPDKEGLGAGVKSGSAEGSRMRRLIYGPFQPVCFKRDLAYTLTLTRFFPAHFTVRSCSNRHAFIPTPHMYMFMTLVSFTCAGDERQGA